MAEITSQVFLDGMAALTGHAEDTTRGVRDRTRGMVAETIKLDVLAENVTVTDAVTEALSGTAVCHGGGRVISAYYVPKTSVTISATDNITVSVITRKNDSYSLTFSVATLQSTTDGWSPNGVGRAAAFTVSTTTDNITVNRGDTFHYIVAKNGAAGANGHTVPQGSIIIEVR